MKRFFEWSHTKRLYNLENHGLDFIDVSRVWTSLLVIQEDNHKDYGEKRYVVLGLLHDRVVVIVYTLRGLNIIRIISFRRANAREIKIYEKNIKSN